MSQSQNPDQAFRSSRRPEVALITNHGFAGAKIPIGGATDTGGQIVYVNTLARTLAELGYRVTIFARGGFPHFESDVIRDRPEYLGEYVRYVFVPGGGDQFIRKEDIAVALDEQVDWLDAFIRNEASERGCRPWSVYEFINTHYWDAGVIGMRLVERWRNDVIADAAADLLGGAVPPDRIRRIQDERHWLALGEAPARHLGAILLDADGSPRRPLRERVRAVARRWAASAPLARSADAEMTMTVGVEETLATAMDGAVPAMQRILAAEAIGRAMLDLCAPRAEQMARELRGVDRHVWTPHSLGELKDENYRDRPKEVRRDLKFCERRSHERTICHRTRAFAATSAEIAEQLCTHYRADAQGVFYFPPCIDRRVFREYTAREQAATYEYLSAISGVPVERLRAGKIVFETSRMDRTKRKDLLLRAFAPAASVREDAYLFIGGGPENDTFMALVAERDARPELRGRAFLTGFIPDEHVGPLFSIADLFVSASEMEGFGMSVSQAAATGTAVVSSDLIPFSVQYVPDDAVIVPAGNVDGFANAILRLLEDDDERTRRAARLTEKVNMLDWKTKTSDFVEFLKRHEVAPTEAGATI